MNDNGRSPRYLGRREEIKHDLRNALFTLRTGIALLGHVREDPDKFAEVQQLLEHDVRTAAVLIDELLGRPDLTGYRPKSDRRASTNTVKGSSGPSNESLQV